MSPIEYRNCSEFETDVRFQNYEKRDECVGYVSAINIDEGINAGEGGTRDFLLEESGLGQVRFPFTGWFRITLIFTVSLVLLFLLPYL